MEIKSVCLGNSCFKSCEYKNCYLSTDHLLLEKNDTDAIVINDYNIITGSIPKPR